MKQLIAALLLFAPGALAQDASQLADFNSGKYAAAADVQAAEATPDLLAFKARAVLASGICGEAQPSNALLSKAEDFARAALSLNPNHVEAQLQLAIALSLKARPMTNREAMKAGYGSEAKELAERALQLDPVNAYANGFMAVWHLEVVRRGGALGSRIMGASVKQARTHYQRANAASSDDASIHWQYARALAALNAKKYKTEINAALSAAVRAPKESHVESVMSARAGKLQKMLQVETRKTVEAWAESTL